MLLNQVFIYIQYTNKIRNKDFFLFSFFIEINIAHINLYDIISNQIDH